MDTTRFGERLKIARRAAGLSLRALAAKVNLSQTAIQKYERGATFPSSTTLQNLCEAIGVPLEALFRVPIAQLAELKFRKRSNLSVKTERQILYQVRDHLERRLELEALYPGRPTPPSIRFEAAEAEEAAEAIREEWQLGTAPICDLTDAMESHGIRVVEIECADRTFDGLFLMHDEEPVIVVSRGWPGDRQRFTVAHELGHYILHPSNDEEAACNRFAGALLFPREAVVREFGRRRIAVEMRELFLAKQGYGLSMAAVLYRLYFSGVISGNCLKRWQDLFAKRGWRVCEPGAQIDPERPHHFEQLVFRALGEEAIGESKAAELLAISIDELREMRSADGWPSDCSE